MELSNILPADWKLRYIPRWLEEDIPSFDTAGVIVGSSNITAMLYCKETCILAGSLIFTAIFEYLGCTVTWNSHDGQEIKLEDSQKRIELARVTGPANIVLQGERIALNIITRLSGIATKANRMRSLADSLIFKGIIAGSRKNTPGFRLFEKYALLVGGCDAHRLDLSHSVMLKDNHLDIVKSVTKGIEDAKKLAGFSTKVEVECRTLDDALTAAQSNADIVMLDNFTPTDAMSASKKIKKQFPNVIIEVSGGINESNITNYFNTNIDVISMGSLTQGCPAIDFSLKISTSQIH